MEMLLQSAESKSGNCRGTQLTKLAAAEGAGCYPMSPDIRKNSVSVEGFNISPAYRSQRVVSR